MTSPTRNTTAREPVSRVRAIQAAVALADTEGIESLSMRRLARELGIEAMSLYYHVKSKDEILDGMIESVINEMALPAADGEWKSALRERAESARNVLGRHPWAISMVDERTTRTTMRHLDAVIGCLRHAGFSIAMAAHALSLVDSYVHGFALQEASLPLDESGDIGATTEDILAQQGMMAAFPYLAEMGVELILQPGYAYGNEFTFGLRVILDGLESVLAAEGQAEA